MSSETHWTNTPIRQAGEAHPEVPFAISEKLEELLAGPFSERELSKGDKTNYADQLLRLMEPDPTDTEAEP